MSAANFDEAIENVRAYALEQFNTAYTQITTAPLKDPPPLAWSPEQKGQHAAALAKAQGQMAAALQQLGHAEDMISEQRGRVGYDAVVTLMVDTQLAATDAYDKLKQLTGVVNPNTAEQQRIAMLTDVLLALARLSPVPIWQKAPTPTGTAG